MVYILFLLACDIAAALYFHSENNTQALFISNTAPLVKRREENPPLKPDLTEHKRCANTKRGDLQKGCGSRTLPHC